MFWLFGKKKKVEELESDVKGSFSSVKQDIHKVSQWIKHLDGKQQNQTEDLDTMKNELELIKADMHEIKEFISFFGPQISKQAGKQPQTSAVKQTGVEAVQTPVQTAVQTGVFLNLTVMERAIVWALLNADQEMKLSYEDLAALLGKNKSTIRGQINSIKQKSEGLIEEAAEANGKKRLYIPEKMRGFLLKSVKVRVKDSKKAKKYSEKEQESA